MVRRYDWTRAAVVAEARSWIGTPWRHGQHAKGLGADCIGFVGGVGVALGFPTAIAWADDSEFKGYGLTPDQAKLETALAKYLSPIPNWREARAADIFMLRWRKEPAHFAVISSVSPLTIIHCYRVGLRQVVENNIADRWRENTRWQDLIVSAWSYRELVD